MTNFTCPYTEYPVFIRGGSIIPLKIESSYSQMGTSYSKGFITILLTRPLNGMHTKSIHEFNSNGYQVTYNYTRSINQMEVYVTAHPTNRFIFLLNSMNVSPIVVEFKSDELNFQKASELNDQEDFWRSNVNSVYKPTLNKAYIKITDSARLGLHLILKNIN